MPIWFRGPRVLGPPRCRRKITWSYRRGGCRFPAGHQGLCKPTAGRS